MFTTKSKFSTSILTAAFLLGIAACSKPDNPSETKPDDDDDIATDPQTSAGDDDDDDDNDDNDETTSPDTTAEDDDDDNDDNDDGNKAICGDIDGKCYPIDLLMVIDNSGSMAEEQANLAKNFEFLVEQLTQLTDSDGQVIPIDLNLMVTSTDMNHPRCTESRPDGVSDGLDGMPSDVACVDRLPDFIFQESETNTLNKEQICKDFCPDSDHIPEGSKVLHWTLSKSNIKSSDGVFMSNDEAKKALTDSLGCLGLQGIAGCGYEGTLEAMMQALNPKAPHNKGDKPFIRENATLAILVLTDEEDCSPLAPDGFLHWSTDPAENEDHKYWAKDEAGKPIQSSAICWNGGTKCSGDDGSGAYEKCESDDKGVLHPVSRYKKLLNDYWGRNGLGKNVLMLGILGVPEVTAHDEKTNLPTEGGVKTLKYNKKWTAGDIPAGVTDSPAALDMGFGIGKGCSSPETGVAVPPVRVKEVCESLNFESNGGVQNTRCCIESICSKDYSWAVKCLAGLIKDVKPPE